MSDSFSCTRLGSYLLISGTKVRYFNVTTKLMTLKCLLLTLISSMIMLETINERIKHILDTLYNGNVTAMSKATYIKRTTLSSIVRDDGNTPGFDVIEKIAGITSHCISMEWLIRGKGDIYLINKETAPLVDNSGSNNSIHDVSNIKNDGDTINRLLSIVEQKDKQINTLLEIIKAK